ncbi:MAG: serine/threonine protein kinase [Deltaproteobacteria bacterium]|nr:serine/threonine protein kinase [Deltaproteobacteria bacterium]
MAKTERPEATVVDSTSRGAFTDVRYAPGTVVAGRFRVVGFLGRGGMGVVYEATQLSVNRSVALKILPAGISKIPDVVRRFRREAEIIASLAHPNIVTLIDFGQTESGELFLAMELVRGVLLADQIQRGIPLPAPTAISIVQQVLLALEHAHAKGIIHRDLKPSNVMLMETGDGVSFVKLLDFGIAKVLTEPTNAPTAGLTGVGVVVGTPFYVAPEQAAGGKADARSDIYSAGLLLYELLTGTPPFFSEDTQEVLVRQLYEDLPALPVESARGVAPSVLSTLQRSTKKRPSDRFQTAREMRFALVGEMARDTRTGDQALAPVVHAKAARTTGSHAETPTAFETRAVTGPPPRPRWRRVSTLGAAAVALAVAVAATVLVSGRDESLEKSDRVAASGVNEPARAPASAPAEDFNAKAQRSGDARNESSSLGASAPLRQIPATAPASAYEHRDRGRSRARTRARERSLLSTSAPAPAPVAAPAEDFNAKAQRSGDAKNEASSLGASAPLRQIPAPAIAPRPRPAPAPTEIRVIAWCNDTDKPCWAAISLNGADQQTTRVARFKAKDGKHLVRVDKEGYETAFRNVTVAGASTEITVRLTRTP